MSDEAARLAREWLKENEREQANYGVSLQVPDEEEFVQFARVVIAQHAELERFRSLMETAIDTREQRISEQQVEIGRLRDALGEALDEWATDAGTGNDYDRIAELRRLL